jgi:adenosylcobinamide-GDP ribazoletransferase
MTSLKQQIVCFLLAVSFFTRIPIPANTPFSNQLLNQSSRYFSLVGWLVGLIGAFSVWLSSQLFPVSVSIVISMLTTILLTGAFHEDGLADSADGLGGGMTIEKKLIIMKDSRLGTYGAVALWGGLLLKFTSLQEIGLHSMLQVMLALVVLHPLSRAVAGSLIYDMTYVRDQDAKAKPVAEQQRSSDLIILLVLGGLPILLLPVHLALPLVLTQCLLRYAAKRYLSSRLGGYTGDCLGAVQQVSEIAGYLLLLALINHGGMTWHLFP